MTSAAKIEANRQNARRSTGPRSNAGKVRVSRNAFKHGLSVPIGADDFHAEREELVQAFEGEFHCSKDSEEFSQFVEGQVELLRTRRFKADLINRAAARLKTSSSDIEECVATGFGQKAQTAESVRSLRAPRAVKTTSGAKQASAEREHKTGRE
jgi:hypothetical protein